jgi:hypothetical protein
MFNELLVAFVIMGICLVIHVAGIILVGEQIVRRRRAIQERTGHIYTGLILTSVFVIFILLHAIEAAIWAAFYRSSGLFTDFEKALYFSLTTYSTVGYGDVLLPERWRLLGTIESVSGVLLCGLAAAFLFAIINALFQFRIQRFHGNETE